MNIEGSLVRLKDAEKFAESLGVKGMMLWGCSRHGRFFCLSYDKTNRLWNSSIKTPPGATKYFSDTGFEKREDAVAELEKAWAQ